VPTEPAPYDLVVESDEGFARIQVKSTTIRDAGRWSVSISRREYLPGVPNEKRARKECAYSENQVDFFFIVTGDGSQFLVPLKVTNGAGNLVLDSKYAAFRVQLPGR
jgi:PD-(D/E)XK endonuclease